MSSPPQKKPHHHGNLRAALIEAGIDILRTDGLSGLTLRKCAARAGVSHAAPAHHFDGVEGLRVAIAHEGYDRFRQYMLDARDAGEQTDLGRIKAICHGYLAFARAEPALFDLIFSFRANSHLTAEIEANAAPAYMVLRETCAPFVRPGQDPVVIETQVWSLVHGYAHLILTGRFQPPHEVEDAAVLALLDYFDRLAT